MEQQNIQNAIGRGRGLPAELIYEIFASLPLEKTFGLLAKMPNSLLARNIRQMLKKIEETIKANKWNAQDCGPNLAISANGLVIINFGSNQTNRLTNTVRAHLPILNLNQCTKKPYIASYFEVEIRSKTEMNFGIGVGFCTRQFPLRNRCLGWDDGAIGIWHKGGIKIDQFSYVKFENSFGWFCVGDVIGVGLVKKCPTNLSVKCFATCNGKLLGFFDLPPKFAAIVLFPTVTLVYSGNSICANFGQEKWRYNPSELIE